MDMKKLQQLMGSAVAVVILVACGGGGGSDMAGIDRTGGPRSAGAFGTVTAFGSVVVNGVRYDTAGATFTIDGAPGMESDLGLGDVVLIEGSIDSSGTTGTADNVTYDDAVEGVILGIDRTGGLLLVLGQTVKVNAETTFADSVPTDSIAGLNVGDVIEVAGFVTADAQISATRIDLKPSGGEFEVTGVVANLDSANSTFMINDLVVDFSAAQLRDFDSGEIAEGDRVEAKGTDLGPNDELLATSVQFKGDLIGGSQGDLLEVEGFITRFASSTDFDVATQPVTTNAQTIFEGGTEADLGLNVKVEVEGEIDGGVLVASKVDIRRAKVIRMTADVDSVDAANDRLTVLGIDIEVDELTRLEDKSNADVEPLTLADINAGEYVEIRGSEDPSSSADIVAALLEREDPDAEAELQGFVAAVNDPSLEILGVTIETNGTTVFRDENDNVLTATEFFNQVDVGRLVKGKGAETSATVITATEVEFELEQ